MSRHTGIYWSPLTITILIKSAINLMWSEIEYTNVKEHHHREVIY